jgi:predicted DNA-binding protein YlxM (UPF0122 family)
MKEHIDEYFKTKTKFLYNNVVQRVNAHKGRIEKEYWNDIINELYLYCIDNQDKIEVYYNKNGFDGIEAFCIMWLRNQSAWALTPFKRKYNLHRNYDEYEIGKDKRVEEHIDLTKTEYERDLENIYEQTDINKIIGIFAVYKVLEKHEQILFDLFYTDNLKKVEIAKLLNISTGSVRNIIKEMDEKIILLYKKHIKQQYNDRNN